MVAAKKEEKQHTSITYLDASSCSHCQASSTLKTSTRDTLSSSIASPLSIDDFLDYSSDNSMNALAVEEIDWLRSCKIFRNFSKPVILSIFKESKIQCYRSREVIFRQGEESDSAFYILKGSVSLSYWSGSTKTQTQYSKRSRGDILGDMSLLAGTSRYATAIVLEDSKILIIPKDIFTKVIFSSDKISQLTIQKWHKSIIGSRLKLKAYQDNYYKELMSVEDDLPCGQILGSSQRAKLQRQLLDKLIDSGEPVLLIGEKGVQKTKTASYIHKKSLSNHGHFIVFNPEKIPSFILTHLAETAYLKNSAQLQIAALFGVSHDKNSSAELPWHGLVEVVQDGTLVIENCDSMKGSALRQLEAFIQTGSYTPLESNVVIRSAARIIITARNIENFSNDFVSFILKNTILLDPLRKRKKDLKKLVHRLLECICRSSGSDLPNIDPEALNKLMVYEWPGNYRELEDVLIRAVNLKKSDTLIADDIFIGNVSITGKSAFNLLKVPFIEKIAKSLYFPLAPQIFISVMFAFILILGVWGNPSPESNISLLLVWANWEPLLILSCLFLSRIWCSFCPVGFISQHISGQTEEMGIRGFSLSLETLEKLFFLSAVGLATVFWAQATFDMWVNPKETSYLLLAMLASAILFSVLFEGRVWCRFVCPLGQMVATFARTSFVEIRSNYSYCSNECRTYDCSVSKNSEHGCTMAKGPFSLDTNRDCTLCASCIKACPHQSVRLNLRSPGWELWNSKSADIAARLFIPLLWATQLFRGISSTETGIAFVEFSSNSKGVSYALILITCVFISFTITAIGVKTMKVISDDASADSGTLFVFSMLPLVYANEISIRLVPLLNHAADFFRVLGNQIGCQLPQVVFRLDFQSIQILQVIIVLAGLFASILVGNLQNNNNPSSGRKVVFRYTPLFLMVFISLAFY